MSSVLPSLTRGIDRHNGSAKLGSSRSSHPHTPSPANGSMQFGEISTSNRTPSPASQGGRKSSRSGRHSKSPVNTFGANNQFHSMAGTNMFVVEQSPTSGHSIVKYRLPQNSQGQAVQTLLETLERDAAVSAAVSERHAIAWERRMALVRQQMASRLEAHLVKEGTRATASKARLSKDSYMLISRWSTMLVLGLFTKKLSEIMRRERAKSVVTQFLAVRCMHFLRRFKHRKARSEKVEALLQEMPPRPTVSQLQLTTTMLARLPGEFLHSLIPLLVPRCFLEGEAVCIDDAPGIEAIFIQQGTVTVCKRPRKGSENSGSAIPMSVTNHLPFQLSGPGVVLYELCLFHSEQYESKIIAGTDVKSYALSVKKFQQHVQAFSDGSWARSLPSSHQLLESPGSSSPLDTNPDTGNGFSAAPSGLNTKGNVKVSQIVDRLMDLRRAQAIESNHRMTEETVRKSSPIFADWSTKGITELLSACRCQISRKDDIVVPRGKFGKILLFVVSGKLEAISVNAQTPLLAPGQKESGTLLETFREGQCVGALEAYLHKKDNRTFVRAVQDCDVWALRAKDFRNFACHETACAILPAVISLEGVPYELCNHISTGAAKAAEKAAEAAAAAAGPTTITTKQQSPLKPKSRK